MNPKYVAKSILVDGSNRFLAVRRSADDTHRPSQWDLPGGGVDDDKGETFQQGAVREIKEEVGLTIPSENLQLIYQTTEEKPDRLMTRIFYIARVVTVEPVVLSEEHDYFEWMTFEEGLERFDYQRHRDVISYVMAHGLIPELPSAAAKQ